MGLWGEERSTRCQVFLVAWLGYSPGLRELYSWCKCVRIVTSDIRPHVATLIFWKRRGSGQLSREDVRNEVIQRCRLASIMIGVGTTLYICRVQAAVTWWLIRNQVKHGSESESRTKRMWIILLFQWIASFLIQRNILWHVGSEGFLSIEWWVSVEKENDTWVNPSEGKSMGMYGYNNGWIGRCAQGFILICAYILYVLNLRPYSDYISSSPTFSHMLHN